jgi:hypothetical protein
MSIKKIIFKINCDAVEHDDVSVTQAREEENY